MQLINEETLRLAIEQIRKLQMNLGNFANPSVILAANLHMLEMELLNDFFETFSYSEKNTKEKKTSKQGKFKIVQNEKHDSDSPV